MDESHYPPVATCDIPLPVLETPSQGSPGRSALPRILLQAASSRGASRKLGVLIAVFLALSLLEAALLARLPVPEALVVYPDTPRRILLEASPP